MWSRCVSLLFVVLGCGLLFTAIFPIFVYIRFEEPWQTALVASKLIMLPAGAICLFAAAALTSRRLRH